MQPAGQSLLEGFNQFLAAQWQQSPAGFGGAATAEAIQALQREWMARHARLWQGMLNKKPDQPAPEVASAPPGDRRFDHPAWAASPMYDYLRQAYLLNADYLQRLADNVPDEQARSRENEPPHFLGHALTLEVQLGGCLRTSRQ
jgi:polyhydroxyalkanoate synthase